MIANELSVEPSLTHIASKSLSVWNRRLSRQLLKYFSQLYTGIITEKVGLSIVLNFFFLSVKSLPALFTGVCVSLYLN